MRSTFYITLAAATAILSGTVDSVVLPQNDTNLAQTYMDVETGDKAKTEEKKAEPEIDEDGNVITDPDAPKGEDGKPLTQE